MRQSFITARVVKLAKFMFSQECVTHSFHRGWGVTQNASWDRSHGDRGYDLVMAGGDLVLGGGDLVLRGKWMSPHTPGQDHPQEGNVIDLATPLTYGHYSQCAGRWYASYWNAFLLDPIISLNSVNFCSDFPLTYSCMPEETSR